MARSPNTEIEGMSDAQIRELIELARGTLSDRFSTRIDEWRSLAHEAGYELTVTKIGESPGRGRRRKADSSDTDDRRREVTPKYYNPMCYSLRWFQSPIVWNRNPFSVRFEKEGVEWPNRNLQHCTVQ